MRLRRYWAGCSLLAAALAGSNAAGQTCGPWSRIGAEPPFGGASLNAVAWGDGQFVAVGDEGLIATSPDGVVWTRQENVEAADLLGIAWNGARYVAVGGWGVILVSDDAASWRRVAVACDQQLTAVTWSGARFIAVGDGVIIIGSTDGEAWDTVSPAGGVDALRSVACGGGLCVAGGGYTDSAHFWGVMFSSADGLTWQGIELNLHARDLVWAGDRFVAAGFIGDGLDVAAVGSSQDGLEWIVQESGIVGVEYSSVAKSSYEIIAFGAFNRLLVSADGLTWSERVGALGGWVNDATWANGRWVAVGWQGQTAVSEDGERWDSAAPGLFDSFGGTPAASNGSVLVAAARDATSGHPVVYLSVDGVAWQRNAVTAVGPTRAVETFGGGFLGLNGDGVATSPDGIAWTARPLPAPSPELEGLACNAARCVAVGKEIVTSEDGVTWSRSALPAGSLAAHDVVWTGSRFVAVGHLAGAAAALVLESADGLVWETRTQAGIEPPTALAAHGGRLVAIGGGQGRVFTATEGQPWTELVLASNDDLRALSWTGSFFAALGRKPDNVHPALWVSWDGTTWSEVAVPAGDDLRAIFGVGPRLYLLGERGTILSTSCGGYAIGRAPRRRLPSRP